MQEGQEEAAEEELMKGLTYQMLNYTVSLHND